MAALPDVEPLEPFSHVRLAGGRLYVSCCAECGLVVAGSPHESLLYLAERIHTCPVYLKYHGLRLVP